jgi:hypothetical protein
MSDELERMRDALATIAKVASEAAGGGHSDDYQGGGDGREDRGGESGTGSAPDLACIPKSLPGRLLVKAAATARKINPMNAPLANAPLAGPDAAMALDSVQDPLRIAVLTSKYWGPGPRRLSVSFMQSTPANVRSRIISHLNAWSQRGGISFVATEGTGDVRISTGPGGYWSYLGTDVLLIPPNRPTMNLEAFTMSTPEDEYRRVVRHEAGHTLGFPHEHMRRALVARIDREKSYAYFLRTQGWDRQTVDQQVLTPLDEKSIMATPADQDSIMCYQLPASITRDGQPIRGGLDINRTDFDFVARIYPRPAPEPDVTTAGRGDRYDAPERAPRVRQEDWPEEDDVEVSV